MMIKSVGYFIITMLVLCCLGCTFVTEENRITAHKGKLDLTKWDFGRDGTIELSGEYEFYWKKHIDPHIFHASDPPQPDTYVQIPKIWNDIELNGSGLPGHGYATYRLQITTNEIIDLSLKILDMGTAFKAFIDGEEVLAVGVPGESKGTTVPRYDPAIVDFTPDSTHFDLVFWVSNFHHRKGGTWEVIKLGFRDDVHSAQENQLYLDLFLFVSIFVMGLYHIGLFLLRTKDRHSLYFGLFCLLVAARFTTQGEIYAIKFFPTLNWDNLVRLEYLSFYLAPITFTMFLYNLYRRDFHRTAIRLIQYITIPFVLIVLVTQPNIFSHSIEPFQVFTVVSCSYGIYILFVASRKKREGARIVLAGFVVLTLTIIYDILEFMKIIKGPELLLFGLLAFILFLTVLIAYRWSRAFKTVEIQKYKLATANSKYKKELAERRKAEQEARDLQEKLTRSHKMEAIGVLAGGVAHDLNNILTGIVTYPDLLLSDLPSNSSFKEPLETIKSAGFRAAAVVQDLLTLSRRGVMHFEVLNLNDVVEEYLHSPEFKSLKLEAPDVKIETHFAPDLRNMSGSVIHLRKAIMNLVSNAAEAQPLGGKIVLSTFNCSLTELLKGYEDIDPGEYVLFQIKDNGHGINQDDLKKIFEPFYSTKLTGRSGAGLGMAVVWGAVQDHHGYIDIHSTEGRGTRLDLYFPATSESLSEKESDISVDQYHGKYESVLIVDDVDEQRYVAERILKKLGYSVASVGSGEAAVEYVKSNSVDLVVLDMILDTGMDGYKTYREMKNISPDIKAVIVSGYSETEEVKESQNIGAGQYIKKPYALQTLGLAVRNELDKTLR